MHGWRSRIALIALVGLVAGAFLVVPGSAGNSGGIKLTGAAEVPGPGDPDGSGRAGIKLRIGDERVCFDLRWNKLDPATAAHIHAGAKDEAGPPVVTLFLAGESGLQTLSETRTRLRGCSESFAPPEGTTVAELLRDIKDNRNDYYVNLHSTEFPAGAIRGQMK